MKNFLAMIYTWLVSTKKGLDVGSGFQFMIGALVITILAFTWFFPTLNGATALNNTSTLWLGGVNYNWAVPLIVVLIIIALVVYYFKETHM